MEIGFCLIFNPYFSLGDNYCDTLFDNAECLFDLGDCQVGVSVSPEPIGPISTTSSVTIPPGCIIPPGVPIYYLGDAYCDSMLNTEECEFDMGDCSGIQSTAPPIFASTTPTTIPEGCIIPDGVPPSWLGKCSKICFCLINPIFSLGDNFCDALFDNAECLFDLGDCQVVPDQNDLYIPEGCVLPGMVPATWLGKVILTSKN